MSNLFRGDISFGEGQSLKMLARTHSHRKKVVFTIRQVRLASSLT